MKKLWPILVSAFLLRLVLTPLYHHGDADIYFYWAKYLWEKKDFFLFLGKNVPNAMPATYPPIFYYLLFLWQGLYKLIEQGLWWLNLQIPAFPSNLIFWYQSYSVGIAFNKIPAILADLGCALLIHQIALKVSANQKLSKTAMFLFLFLPATWYNSAYWGQIDSLYAFFILLGFFFALKNRFLWGTFSLAISALIKPTGLFILPAYLIFAVKKKKIIDVLLGTLFSLILAFVLYFPFQPLNTLAWSINFYLCSFRGEINHLVSNAFNFWAFLFGFDQRPDNFPLWGIPLNLWAFSFFTVIAIPVVKKLWRKTNSKTLIIASFLLALNAFLFLPRIHERYFYTTLVFAAILGGIKKKWLSLFAVTSIVHFLNLYHFWWSPKIPLLISLLSNLNIVRLLIAFKIAVFISFYRLLLSKTQDT